MKHTNKGFTLVELLVVVAIIGLLAGIAVVSVNSVRVKARDAKRIADVKQIQNALELYNNTKGGQYPLNKTGDVPLTGMVISEGGIDTVTNTANMVAPPKGGEIYINVIPDDPTTGQDYVYKQCEPVATALTYCRSYFIEFKTEAASSVGAPGTYCANTTGVSTGACPAQ